MTWCVIRENNVQHLLLRFPRPVLQGLGKTCQAAAALATIFGKTGIRANDDVHLRRVREVSLPTGNSGRGSASGDAGAAPTPLSAVASDVLATGARSLLRLPVLILVPKAVAKNWERELAAWGWFVVRLLGDAQNRAARSAMLRDAEVCAWWWRMLT